MIDASDFAALTLGCAGWNSVHDLEPVHEQIICSAGIVLPEMNNEPNFAYLSVASPLESMLFERAHIADHDGTELSVAELAARLIDGQVAVAARPSFDLDQPPTFGPLLDVTLPETLIDRRSAIRRVNVRLRFLLRQIGLEEVSTLRGASPVLYELVASLWSLDLSLCVDPAMLLTQGADRQRFVDATYTARAKSRLPEAARRLSELGVTAYPRSVIV